MKFNYKVLKKLRDGMGLTQDQVTTNGSALYSKVAIDGRVLASTRRGRRTYHSNPD